MIIFIDESGVFANPQKKNNVVSCVGALSVPENCLDLLFQNFTELKKSWGFESKEIKGSQLSEDKASQVVNLCRKFDVVLKVIATDVGMMTYEIIEKHKIDQANRLLENAKAAHINTHNWFNDLATQFESLSNQLYLQSTLMTLLLDAVLRDITLYYCQRNPQCLGSFVWSIDAKNKQVSPYEKLWSTVCMPFLQSISLGRPLIQITDGDYSSFEKFHREKEMAPEYLAKNMREKDVGKPFKYLDINGIFSTVNFSNSEKELGLQLIDLLVTIVRRSFSGTMKIEGWKNIGNLMLQAKRGENAVPFFVLGDGPSKVTTPYGSIVTHYSKTARSPFK